MSSQLTIANYPLNSASGSLVSFIHLLKTKSSLTILIFILYKNVRFNYKCLKYFIFKALRISRNGV